MPATHRYVDIGGTHSSRRSSDWDDLTSPFSRFRAAHGWAPMTTDPRRLYKWSTDLDGLPGDGGHADWDAAGRSLANYFFPLDGEGEPAIPPTETRLFSHSHGLQVVLIACGVYGLKVDTLFDVAGPVRKDMMPIAEKARENIRYWLHLRAGKRDWWQWLGALFDGRFGIYRDHPLADRNDRMPGGHSDVLRDPELFPLWLERGWLEVHEATTARVDGAA